MTTGADFTSGLRPDLEFSSQQHLDKNYTIVKDPVTKRYFRFTQSQAVLLDLLRGPVEVEAVARAASERLGAAVPQTTVAAFLGSLEQKLLLDTESVREKLANYKQHKLKDRSLLYLKLASINPERIFSWLIPRTRWAFTTPFHVAALGIIATGFILNFLHWKELTVSVQDLFNLHGLVLIWIVTLTVVTLHEFSHGLTCCHFGGKVQEVGFMLIYFQPAFYCDVSDSWMFPSKKSRMWVTFAGGYFQLVVWGLCTILWRVTDTDTLINQLAVVVIVFAGLQTLINFNPLIKLDGYYILSDFLEIPNLRVKAVSFLWDRVAGRNRSQDGSRETRAKLIYGMATIAFSTTLLVYVYTALYSWATSHYAFAGLMGFLMFSGYTLRRTAVDSIAGLRAVAARAAFRKFRNATIIVAAFLVMFVGRWDLKIPAEFKVIARNEATIRPETGGIIVEMLVNEGTHVAKGQVLARLRDFDKQQKISELTGELEQKKNELSLLKAGARPEEIDLKRKLVETKRVELENATRNSETRNELIQSRAQKQAELQLDEQNLARSKDLAASGLIARADLEKATTAVDVRKREIDQIEASIRALDETSAKESDLKARELAEAQSDLKLMMAGSRQETIAQTETEVQKLSDQVRLLNDELSKTEVRATIDGIVTTPFVERRVGQNLDAGDELCRIVDTRRITIEMQVPEKEMADVHTGNPVFMKVRGFPYLDLDGRVDFIAPVAQNVGGQQMVVVRSELPNDDAVLKPDMTGVAKISCGDRRIIDLMTRRLVRWIRTEFWDLLP